MKISQLIISAGLLVSALTACNDVDYADRFKPTGDVESKKNVLIEDFTGQRCVNCPKAADAVQEMQKTFGEGRLIAVSIHGGSLSMHDSETSGIGLATDQGNEYNEHWNVKSWPKGFVDRTGGLQDYEMWNGSALERFNISPKVNLSTEVVSFDKETRTLKVKADVHGNEEVTGRLQVWLTESNIRSVQLMPSGMTNENYVHNHVFRASINDAYGDELHLNAGESQTKEYTYQFSRSYWNEENASVVVFFYNDADGVMQVVDAPLYKNGQPVDKELKSITLNKTSMDLVVGGSEVLDATFDPSDANDKTVTWSSSDESVATVTDGRVTAVSEGVATITVTSTAHPEVQASCTVNVTKAEENQIIRITFNGKEVKDGDVLVIPVHYVDYGEGFGDFEFGDESHGSDPMFTNVNEDDEAHIRVVSTLQGSEFKSWAICGLGLGVCVPMTTMSYICDFYLYPGDDPETSQIHYTGFEKGVYGSADIKCDVDIDGRKLSYTLRYVYSE